MFGELKLLQINPIIGSCPDGPCANFEFWLTMVSTRRRQAAAVAAQRRDHSAL